MAAGTSKLTRPIVESAGRVIDDAQLLSIARKAYDFMRRNSRDRRKFAGRGGVDFPAPIEKAIRGSGSPVLNGLTIDERAVVVDAVRQYLKDSGVIRCVDKTRGSIVWWVSDEWTGSATFSAKPGMTSNDQKNWYETKVTEKEVTNPHGDEPVAVRWVEPKPSASKAVPVGSEADPSNIKIEFKSPRSNPPKQVNPLNIDQRWLDELQLLLNRSKIDGPTFRVFEMAASYDEPFTTLDFARLYDSDITVPAPVLASLSDAGLISATENTESRSYLWSTTVAQRRLIRKLLDERVANKTPSRANDYQTRYVVMDVMSKTTARSTPELAQKLFMTRVRLLSTLQTLAAEGQVRRLYRGTGSGRDSHWLLTGNPPPDDKRIAVRRTDEKIAPKAKSASVPAVSSAVPATPTPADTQIEKPVTSTPAESQLAPSPSSMPARATVAAQSMRAAPSSVNEIATKIAEMIEPLAHAQSRDRVRTLEMQLEGRTREVETAARDADKLRSRVSELENEAAELRKWKADTQAKLSSFLNG